MADDSNKEKVDLWESVRELDPDLADRFDFYKREAQRQEAMERAASAGDTVGRGCGILMFLALCYGLFRFGGALGSFVIGLFK